MLQRRKSKGWGRALFPSTGDCAMSQWKSRGHWNNFQWLFLRFHQLAIWKNTMNTRRIRPSTKVLFLKDWTYMWGSETKLPERGCQGKSYCKHLRVLHEIKKQTPSSGGLSCLRRPKGVVPENTNLFLWNSKVHTILAALRILLRIWTESQTKRIGREMLDLPEAMAAG